MTKTRYVTLLAVGAALGGFLFGSDTSAMNGALPGIEDTLEKGAKVAREIQSGACEGTRTSGVIGNPWQPAQMADTVSSASGLCCMSR